MNTPSYSDLYGGEYVNPDDFARGDSHTGKIVSQTVGKVFCKNKGENTKVILVVSGLKKKIVVNKTSAKRFRSAWGEDFTAWVGKTITITGGQVNGKAATLCTPVKDAPKQGNQGVLADRDMGGMIGGVLTGGTGPIEPGGADGLETENVVFIKISKIAGKGWTLLDANGQLWSTPMQEMIDSLAAGKVKDRQIAVTHFGHQIESWDECK